MNGLCALAPPLSGPSAYAVAGEAARKAAA